MQKFVNKLVKFWRIRKLFANLDLSLTTGPIFLGFKYFCIVIFFPKASG